MSHKVLHTYQLRGQTGHNARGRRSMLLGTLRGAQKGVWVSFHRRPGIGDHTRYWNDDNTCLKYDDFQNNLVYETGLELSHFSSKKTKPQSIQKRIQKSLIQKLYHQGGKQYEGDLEDVEINQAAKDHEGKRKRAITESSKPQDQRANKKIQRAEADPDSLLGLFRHNAQTVSETTANLRKLLMEEWSNALPLEVLRESLEESHSQGSSNACETSPYRKWLERGGPCAHEGNQGNGDDECDQRDQQEEHNGDGEESDEEEGGEPWEGISDNQQTFAYERDSLDSEQAADTRDGITAREAVYTLQREPSSSPLHTISERLRVLTKLKIGAELGLLGLHHKNNEHP